MFIKLLVFLFIALYCLSCPYTKVEESFNIQAAHDVMHHGQHIAAYDHIQFPGVVPRSFVGSIILACIAQAIVSLLQLANIHIDNGITEQIIVRLVLGALVALALLRIQSAVKRLFGYPASVAFVLLMCCQFHFIFWSSRTLPNTVALPLVLSGLGHWLESLTATTGRLTELRGMIYDLVIAGIVFRFEAGILLVILVVLEWLVYRTLPFKFMVVHGVASALVSLVLTVSVDSYFWQRINEDGGGISLLWPEGAVFYFNAILNKSSEWGTLPFYAYFVSFLPRLLLISYPLAWIAFIRDARVRRIMIPSLIYIGLFSCVPHKEWRFIIYTIPIFTAAAASLVGNALSVARTRSSKIIITLLAAGGMLASLACSLLMLYISMHNYPGGHALHRLHQIATADSTPVSVHLDVPTAMTGASRFGQVAHPQWSYHKNESHTTPDDYIEAEYTYLITSDPAFHHKQFQLVDQTWGLEAVKLKSPKAYLGNLKHFASDPWVLLPVDIITQPKLYTLKLMDPQTTWLQHTLRKHRVVLYSKTYCPYCRRAKQVLDRYCKDNYFVVEVDQRLDGLALKQSLIELSRRRTFPNLFVDGQSIGGSDEILRLEKLGKLSEILPCTPYNW